MGCSPPASATPLPASLVLFSILWELHTGLAVGPPLTESPAGMNRLYACPPVDSDKEDDDGDEEANDKSAAGLGRRSTLIYGKLDSTPAAAAAARVPSPKRGGYRVAIALQRTTSSSGSGAAAATATPPGATGRGATGVDRGRGGAGACRKGAAFGRRTTDTSVTDGGRRTHAFWAGGALAPAAGFSRHRGQRRRRVRGSSPPLRLLQRRGRQAARLWRSGGGGGGGEPPAAHARAESGGVAIVARLAAGVAARGRSGQSGGSARSGPRPARWRV